MGLFHTVHNQSIFLQMSYNKTGLWVLLNAEYKHVDGLCTSQQKTDLEC